MRIEQVIVRWIRCSVSCTRHPDSFTDLKQTHCFLQCEHLSFWWNKHIVFVSAGFPPLFPGCPISPASKAVDAGYTSTLSGTRGTVLLCRPGWKREGKNLVVSRSKRPNWGWFNKTASVQHWVICRSLMLKTVCSIWAEPISHQAGNRTPVQAGWWPGCFEELLWAGVAVMCL